MEELIHFHNNKAFTTSRKVAGKFNKRHDNVIRSIKELENVDNFSHLNFEEAEYIDDQGKPRLEYIMTRDGFVFLVMGFTGKKASKFKIEYINAFNEAERKLKALVTPQSIEEMMIYTLQARIEDRKRVDAIENKVDRLIQIHEEATTEINLIERSSEVMPEESLRAKIRKIVNTYCNAKLVTAQVAWNLIYDRLYYRYSIHIKKYKKKSNESYLDVAERNEFLDKIFVIASHELTI